VQWRQPDGDGDAGGRSKRAATITLSVSDGQYNVTEIRGDGQRGERCATITGIANQTINVNTSTGPLSFTIGDVDTAVGAGVEREFIQHESCPTNNIVFGAAGTNRTVTVTPAAGQSGSATSR